MILRAEHLCVGYADGRDVLEDVDLVLDAGQVTGVFGANGSGKTTLLRCLNGSLPIRRGQVTLDGAPLESQRPRQTARRIAVVAQDIPGDLPFTAREVAMQGRFPYWSWWQQETPEDHAIVETVLRRLELEALAERPFGMLSGGERQRVLVARALAQQAPVMLLDEPAAHLDLGHQLGLHALLRELAAEGTAILVTCHDVFLSPLVLDSAILLHRGRVFAAGRPEEVLTPANLEATLGARIELSWPDAHAVRARLDSAAG